MQRFLRGRRRWPVRMRSGGSRSWVTKNQGNTDFRTSSLAKPNKKTHLQWTLQL
jgi:hypothetical protein